MEIPSTCKQCKGVWRAESRDKVGLRICEVYRIEEKLKRVYQGPKRRVENTYLTAQSRYRRSGVCFYCNVKPASHLCLGKTHVTNMTG